MLQKPKKYFRKKSNPNSTQMKLQPGDNIGDPMFKRIFLKFFEIFWNFEQISWQTLVISILKSIKMHEDAGKIWDLSEIN